MPYSLRTIPAAGKFCQELTLDALARAIPPSLIAAVLADLDAQAQRERKLSLPVVLRALIAMNRYTHLAMQHVLRRVAQGLRYVWPAPTYRMPGKSASCYRRYRWGARPLAALLQRACRPLTTPATPGAYRFGLRLLALAGTLEDVPDPPANARAFGRQSGKRGSAAFPQVRGVYLAACGSHAIAAAGFWPCHTSARVGGQRLLRSVGPGTLLLWDHNFHSYAMVAATVQRGAAVLGRLPARGKPEVTRAPPDGARRDPDAQIVVRRLTHTLTAPARPGYAEVHRRITTLLDPALAPARDRIGADHERGEFELTIDELDTHQRRAGQPLRSQRPVGVIQEPHALLLAHYAVRTLLHAAACQAGRDPDRLSFVQAVRLSRAAIPEFQQTAPADHPQRYARLRADLLLDLLPPRRERGYPRVVKRTSTKSHRNRPEHAHWPQPGGPFRAAVALI